MSTSAALYTSESLKAANATSFGTLKAKLDPALLQALQEIGFEFMTPVQEKVMNELPRVNSDCLVQAKTGTGKTLAFLLPAIQNTLQNSPSKGQVAILVMSPTRELALQIAAEAERLLKKFRRPIEVHTAFGGTAKASSLTKFKQGDPKILVATPGRLNDYLSEPDVRNRFQGMRSLILDEADRMLDQGFLPDILKILQALPPKHGPNGGWQGMCFSATIPPRMQQVFRHVLAEDHVSISTLDASEPPTLAKVPQYSVVIPSVSDTLKALLALLNFEIGATKGDPKIIVFGTTANLVALYAKVFEGCLELQVFELHSRLSQPARLKATEHFKTAKRGIMFASDVIGRGMDFPDVSLVLQVGIPLDADAYTHRVGRTARAGKDGRAIILLTEMESFYLRDNRHFPIKPYPTSAEVLRATEDIAPIITNRLQYTDPDVKRKAYSAYMGFMKGFCKKLQINPAGLVQMCNQFAVEGMLSGDIPTMERKTIGKMGLKGVPGIHYETMPSSKTSGGSELQNVNGGGRERVANRMPHNGSAPFKRAKHQQSPSGMRHVSTATAEGFRPEPSKDVADRGGRAGRRGGRGRGNKPNGRGRGQGQSGGGD